MAPGARSRDRGAREVALVAGDARRAQEEERIAPQVLDGDRDDVVPIDPVEKLAKKLGSLRTVSVQFRVISGADHFFAGHMPELVRTIDEYLDRTLTAVA